MTMYETHLFGGALFSAGRGERPEHKTRGSGSRALAAALVATGTLVFISPAQADTIHVPRDFETIQAAIDAAVDFDEIIVAPGEYVETIDFSGKTIVVRSTGGRDVTTINGNYAGTVVTCANGEGAATILDGFTITKGLADEGGGMRNINSSPTVTNCTFIDNTADGGGNTGGGGMFNQGSDVTIIGCVFSDNWADSGGGCLNDFGDMVVVDTVFEGNYAFHVAGLYFDDGSLIMDRCQFLSNLAAYGGGGMTLASDSTSIITNCLFAGNQANDPRASGGGLWANGAATVVNCTFTANDAGCCADLFVGVDAQVTNCIIDSPDFFAICGDGAITYSLVNSGFEGEGNIKGDPFFVNGWRLGAGSPAIDAGNNNAVPRGVKLDLDGNPRFLDDFDVADTGAGRAPIVDMGAYEHLPLPPADLNNDGIVDGGDLLILLGSWGTCVNCDDCMADLDGDCLVGPSDLIILLGSWGDTE